MMKAETKMGTGEAWIGHFRVIFLIWQEQRERKEDRKNNSLPSDYFSYFFNTSVKIEETSLSDQLKLAYLRNLTVI